MTAPSLAALHARGLVPAPLPVAPLLTAAEEARHCGCQSGERCRGCDPFADSDALRRSSGEARECLGLCGKPGLAWCVRCHPPPDDAPRMVGVDRGALERGGLAPCPVVGCVYRSRHEGGHVDRLGHDLAPVAPLAQTPPLDRAHKPASAAESALLASTEVALEVLRAAVVENDHDDSTARERALAALDTVRTTLTFTAAWCGRAQRNLDAERQRVAANAVTIRAFLADPSSLSSSSHDSALALLAQIAGQP